MAIAFVNAADLGNNGGTGPLTAAYAVGSGSNRLLVASIVATGADDLTTVTYAGNTGTIIGTGLNYGTSLWAYFYYWLNPTSGSNNVVISSTTNHYLLCCVSDYSGVAQSGQPDNSNTNTTLAGTTVTTTLTTVADNCWTVGAFGTTFGGGALSAGAGTTERVEGSFSQIGLYDSNGAITPAGSTSLVVNTSALANLGLIVGSFSPAGASAGNPWNAYAQQ